MILRAGGRYVARYAASDDDRARVMALRGAVFRGDVAAPDADAFDAFCRHVMVERAEDGRLVCCYRLLAIPDGRRIGQSYAAQSYDLGALAAYRLPMLELGRFCVAPGPNDPDIMRAGWAVMTRAVAEEGVGMIFGCASFAGTDPDRHGAAFALLRASHLAPGHLAPRVKAGEVHGFGQANVTADDPGRGRMDLPPLLRSYLSLGGWVSDHAVIDRDLGTMHVFTAVEVASIPPARARLLREDAN